MPHSYISSVFHVVFSTKQRTHLIPADHQSRSVELSRGDRAQSRMHVLAVGGIANHVHVLFVLPAETALAEAVRTLKANSSRWMRETSPSFAWQQGYGAFSVSPSQLERVKQYIANQPAHHGTRSFEQEFLSMLQAANIKAKPTAWSCRPLKGARGINLARVTQRFRAGLMSFALFLELQPLRLIPA